ncbi:MAG: helix-turn-helix domain-containing protein [Candidatus Magasanikbacteria bacterium]|nr:helix-turn-helix domain-containing protein [Candidatus Magasanikbacteria bacterium]
MADKNQISTAELAKMLRISRVAIFYKIKRGEIPAIKVGRNYVINTFDLPYLFGHELNADNKREVVGAVRRTVKQYRKTLELLGRE